MNEIKKKKTAELLKTKREGEKNQSNNKKRKTRTFWTHVIPMVIDFSFGQMAIYVELEQWIELGIGYVRQKEKLGEQNRIWSFGGKWLFDTRL